MIPKVRSATAALQNGVKKIHMIGGHIQHCLLLEILFERNFDDTIRRVVWGLQGDHFE